VDCKAPVYGFETADKYQVFKHTFVIENTGSVTLDVTGVKACCGLKATCSTNRIAPQMSAEVTVQFPLSGRTGAQDKMIRVFSSDPHTPEYHLFMRGMVKADDTTRTDIRNVNFGLIRPGATVVTNLIIHGLVNSNRVSVSTPDFSVEQIVTTETTQTVITVKGTAGAQPRLLYGVLQIRGEQTGNSAVEIPLTAAVGWPVMVSPDRITVTPEEAEQPVCRVLFLQSRDQAPVKILKAAVSGNEGQVRIVTIQPDQCRLVVKIAANAGNPPPELRIDAEHNGEQLHISVPVSVRKSGE